MKIFLLLSTIILLITQCKKGDTGSPGPPGPTGNANVETIISTDTNWVYLFNSYYLNILAPNITQSIVDSGSVLGYISFNGSRWYLLPYNYNSTSFFFTYELNHVSIETNQLPAAGIRFKITTISSN